MWDENDLEEYFEPSCSLFEHKLTFLEYKVSVLD
jgi:hypothetical protein